MTIKEWATNRSLYPWTGPPFPFVFFPSHTYLIQSHTTHTCTSSLHLFDTNKKDQPISDWCAASPFLFHLRITTKWSHKLRPLFANQISDAGRRGRGQLPSLFGYKSNWHQEERNQNLPCLHFKTHSVHKGFHTLKVTCQIRNRKGKIGSSGNEFRNSSVCGIACWTGVWSFRFRVSLRLLIDFALVRFLKNFLLLFSFDLVCTRMIQ